MLGKLRKMAGQWMRARDKRARSLSYLRAGGLSSRFQEPPELIKTPAGSRVLVLAPHFDDEAIGCGGTILKCSLEGKKTSVVYMTDGCKAGVLEGEGGGGGGAEGDGGNERETLLKAKRKEEAKRASSVLGIERIFCLDAKDGSLAPSTEMIEKVSSIIKELNPDSVFVPFLLDQHPDHRATAAMLLETCNLMKPTFECYSYEVWTPLYPNCAVDITAQMEGKLEAIKCYRSQILEKDYVWTTAGLNAYRSILQDRSGYTEAFWRASATEFASLYNEISR